MLASDDEIKITDDEQQIPDGKPDVNPMAQQVKKILKFKN